MFRPIYTSFGQFTQISANLHKFRPSLRSLNNSITSSFLGRLWSSRLNIEAVDSSSMIQLTPISESSSETERTTASANSSSVSAESSAKAPISAGKILGKCRCSASPKNGFSLRFEFQVKHSTLIKITIKVVFPPCTKNLRKAMEKRKSSIFKLKFFFEFFQKLLILMKIEFWGTT